MAFGDVLGNVVLGGSNQRVFSPAEQASYAAKYPGVVWRDGVPYVPQAITPSTSLDPTAADYTGANPQYDAGQDPNNTGGLVEADLSDPSFLKQLGRFAAVTSAAQYAANPSGFGAGAGGAGGSGGGTSAAVTGGTSGATGGGMGTTSLLGTLGKYGTLAQNLSSVLGKAAGGSADAQYEKGVFQNQQNQLANQQFTTQQNAQMQGGQLDLDRQKFQATQMKRALIAALLGNMQDVNVSVPGVTNATVTGGSRPSALNKDILAQIQAQGLKTGTSPTWTGGEILTPPTLTTVGDTGGNKFLNALALASSLAGAFGAGKGGQQAQKPYTMGDVYPSASLNG